MLSLLVAARRTLMHQDYGPPAFLSHFISHVQRYTAAEHGGAKYLPFVIAID